MLFNDPHMSTGRRKRGLSPDEVAQNHKRVRTNDSQDEDSSAESDNGLMVEVKKLFAYIGIELERDDFLAGFR